MEALRQHFRPEFLNRIDEIVVFHPLAMEHLKRIVDIQLDRVRRLLTDRRLTLDITEPAKEFLAREGWDPAYGARPLKRAIQHELQDPLALKILQGDFHDGQTIRVDSDDHQLTFTPVVVEAEAVPV
jgi:ATP-dependent Clp protease ATP-binding subunit ClpB